MRPWWSLASLRLHLEPKWRPNGMFLKATATLRSRLLRKAQCDMNDAEEHDGEREVKGRHRSGPRSFGEDLPEPTAKLVPVEGSGLSGPFIRRPVMTVLLTLSVIVAGLATYGKLAVNDLPAVDYPVIQVSCSYPGADPTTMANNIATPLEKQFL